MGRKKILYCPTRTLGEAYAEWKRQGRRRGARIVRPPVHLQYLVCDADRALVLRDRDGWRIVR